MADDSEQVGQDEIEQLLSQSQSGDKPAEPAKQEPAPEEISGVVDQAEIEALLGGGSPVAPAAPTAPASSAMPAAQTAEAASVSQDDIELLLSKAEHALESIDPPGDLQVSALPPGMKTFEFKPFSGTGANKETATLELMRDVQLDMTIELGRTHMHLEDVLKLKQGSVVPLDKLAGDPADIFVNGRLVARGEVLVLNDNFCIRVAELIVGESACA
jgi:flagellar motor switch protein FliN/FliY